MGEKIASPTQYEESIKKVGGFASVRRFALSCLPGFVPAGETRLVPLLVCCWYKIPDDLAFLVFELRPPPPPPNPSCLTLIPIFARDPPPSTTLASFGSQIESFWTIYSHLQPPSALPPVTDILLFTSLIRRPIWEEVPKGAKFTIRLRKGLSDRLWESTVLAAVGDQFEESDGVVGVVLSVRAQEDVISVWTEKSYVDNGAQIKYVSLVVDVGYSCLDKD